MEAREKSSGTRMVLICSSLTFMPAFISRLAGRDIPLPARIFAVADSFDAIISDRPYRRARPIEVALEEIEEGAGTQFDPEVVEAFVSLVQGDSLTAIEGDDPDRLAHVG